MPKIAPIVMQPEKADETQEMTETAPTFRASIHQSVEKLPQEFVSVVRKIEENIKLPLYLLIQRDDDDPRFGQLSESVREGFFKAKDRLPQNKKIALLIDSPGGYAKSAFQIAKILRHHCGGFVAIVPRYAKSAATLLTLGAEMIIFNEVAELGPLDAQIFDTDQEDFTSALDEVQTLERLHAFALDALDQTTLFMLSRTGKKVETVLPLAMRFVSDMIRPLFEKVDVVHFTQRARVLKVAEEYAIRLLRPQYSKEQAEKIARRLVEKYPEHGFVIDIDEIRDNELGLNVVKPKAELLNLINELVSYLDGLNVIGQLVEEEKNDEQNQETE
jgi:ATP-dependent protease ClpP protease subunit